MKKAVAIAIFFCLFAQCIARLGVVGYYELNKNYIAQNLCENRNKPQMKCCGKCYLRKQLKKVNDDGTPSKNIPSKIEKSEIAAFIVPTANNYEDFSFAFLEKAAQTPVFQHLHHVQVHSSIFHPPSISC